MRFVIRRGGKMFKKYYMMGDRKAKLLRQNVDYETNRKLQGLGNETYIYM